MKQVPAEDIRAVSAVVAEELERHAGYGTPHEHRDNMGWFDAAKSAALKNFTKACREYAEAFADSHKESK